MRPHAASRCNAPSNPSNLLIDQRCPRNRPVRDRWTRRATRPGPATAPGRQAHPLPRPSANPPAFAGRPAACFRPRKDPAPVPDRPKTAEEPCSSPSGPGPGCLCALIEKTTHPVLLDATSPSHQPISLFRTSKAKLIHERIRFSSTGTCCSPLWESRCVPQTAAAFS